MLGQYKLNWTENLYRNKSTIFVYLNTGRTVLYRICFCPFSWNYCFVGVLCVFQYFSGISFMFYMFLWPCMYLFLLSVLYNTSIQACMIISVHLSHILYHFTANSWLSICWELTFDVLFQWWGWYNAIHNYRWIPVSTHGYSHTDMVLYAPVSRHGGCKWK